MALQLVSIQAAGVLQGRTRQQATKPKQNNSCAQPHALDSTSTEPVAATRAARAGRVGCRRPSPLQQRCRRVLPERLSLPVSQFDTLLAGTQTCCWLSRHDAAHNQPLQQLLLQHGVQPGWTQCAAAGRGCQLPKAQTHRLFCVMPCNEPTQLLARSCADRWPCWVALPAG